MRWTPLLDGQLVPALTVSDLALYRTLKLHVYSAEITSGDMKTRTFFFCHHLFPPITYQHLTLHPLPASPAGFVGAEVCKGPTGFYFL